MLSDFPSLKIDSVSNVIKCDAVCVYPCVCVCAYGERGRVSQKRTGVTERKMRVQDGFYGCENSFVVPLSILKSLNL